MSGFSPITSFVSVLASGGLLRGEREGASAIFAASLVGEERLAELREWMQAQPLDQLASLRAGALELCIHMAVADRVLDPAERSLFADVVALSELPAEREQKLLELLTEALSESRKLSHLETIAERLDHPVLRELMLGLAWQMACADGFVDSLELRSFDRLSGIFGVLPAEAERIRLAVENAGT